MRRSLLSLVLVAFVLCAAPKRAKADGVLSSVGEVLGQISNAYGSLQAAQFVASLFGIGADISVSTAVDELQSYMQTFRDQQLVANVAGDVALYQAISIDYMNGLTSTLEGIFIANSLRDLSSLQSAIENGDMTDAYLVAPAFNLLSVLYPAALKAFGIQNPANAFPQSYLDSFLTTAFRLDYTLAGAFMVFYNGGSVMVWTQGDKQMWPKYSGWFSCDDSGTQYLCDTTLIDNADGDSFRDCSSFNEDFAPIQAPVALSGGPKDSARTFINGNRDQFLQDPAVQVVTSTIRTVLSLGLSPEVFDWTGSTTSWIPFDLGHVFVGL